MKLILKDILDDFIEIEMDIKDHNQIHTKTMNDFMAQSNDIFNFKKLTKLFGTILAIVALVGISACAAILSASMGNIVIGAIFGTLGVISGIGSIISLVTSSNQDQLIEEVNKNRDIYIKEYEEAKTQGHFRNNRLNEVAEFLRQGMEDRHPDVSKSLTTTVNGDREGEIIYNLLYRVAVPVNAIAYALETGNINALNDRLIELDGTLDKTDQLSKTNQDALLKNLEAIYLEASSIMSRRKEDTSFAGSVGVDMGQNPYIKIVN